MTVISEELYFNIENVVCLCLDCKDKIEEDISQLVAAKESDVTIETDMFLCPHKNCNKNNPNSWFDTEKAMKIHYGNKHSGSISKVKKECKNCQNSFKDYETRNRSRCSKCKLKKSDYNIETCHNCDQDFLSLGQHWTNSTECEYPDISKHQMEILTGMLMGDATVYNHKKDSEKCSLKWSMINEEFMKWLDKNIGYITLGKYEIYRTPEESARVTVQSGLAEEANPENYNTMYRNMTRTHPDFNWFGEWYDKNGNKKFPLEEIELTPLTLKVWYICDGDLSKGNPTHRPRITCTNEKDRIEEIVDFIEDESGLNPYGTSEGRVLFGSEESEKFFDYVGEPLPGFEYKWP